MDTNYEYVEVEEIQVGDKVMLPIDNTLFLKVSKIVPQPNGGFDIHFVNNLMCCTVPAGFRLAKIL